MIIGFLMVGALAGLAAVSWPLYLHLRQRKKPHTEVVPSLILFEAAIARTRKRSISDLLLMAARIAIFTALALFLARPVFRVRFSVPFLRTIGGEEGVLALIVDNGLTAMSADVDGKRFDWEVTRAKNLITNLPEATSVIVTSTTQPVPSPLITPEKALDLLDRMAPLPLMGNVPLAISATREACAKAERRVICLFAPRTTRIWEGDEEQNGRLLIADTTEKHRATGIAEVSSDPLSPSTLQCRLFGTPQSLRNVPMEISAPGLGSLSRIITSREAVQGSCAIDIPESYIGRPIQVRLLLPGTAHPWQDWFSDSTGRATSSGQAVLVFYEDSENSNVMRQLLSATLQSVRPDLSVIYHPQAALEDQSKQFSTLVVFSGTSPQIAEPEVLRAIADEKRIVVLPTHDLAHGLEPGQGSPLPIWAPLRNIPDATATVPLSFNSKSVLFPDLEELVISGLDDLPFGALVSPSMRSGDVNVVSTSQRDAIVSERSRGGALIVAAGIAPTLDNDVLLHPLFPHFLTALVAPAGSLQRGTSLFVGQSVTAQSLFHTIPASSRLHIPGKTAPIEPVLPHSRVLLMQPGFYRLEHDQGTVTAAVNMPRLETAPELDQNTIEKRFPDIEFRWLTENEGIGTAHWDETSGELRTYDLSPLAASLLILALLVEAALLAPGIGRRD